MGLVTQRYHIPTCLSHTTAQLSISWLVYLYADSWCTRTLRVLTPMVLTNNVSEQQTIEPGNKFLTEALKDGGFI